MKSALSSALTLSALLLVGCGPAEPAPPAGRTPALLTQASQDGLTVELLSFAPFAVGQNRVFYRLSRDGQPLTAATLKQRPLMHMMTKSHPCPLVDPAATADANGLFEGLLIFSMASGENEPWKLGLEVTEGAGAPVTVDLGVVAVADSKLKVVLTRDTTRKVVFTFGFPDGEPKVGANAVLVTAHESKNMGMMFEPMDDLVLTMTPEMPSMGHGSSGNVTPTLEAPGRYRGTVVFSMAGDWVVNFTVTAGDAALGAASFAFDL